MSDAPSPPTPAPPPALSDLLDERRLPLLLRRAWYGLNQAFRRRIAHLDLTPDQFTVLRNLAEAGRAGITQSELTRRMSSDPNTVASLVDRMAKAVLLQRETDPADRRARRLRLAPVGRKRFAVAKSIAANLQAELLEGLPNSEREEFLLNLHRLSAACQAASRKGGKPSRPDDSGTKPGSARG